MASKLYVIESEERKGLVKIGFTGSEVKERIQSYREGISDPSTVHETPGSKVFEMYLHKFLGNYRKSIPITFKFLGNVVIGPREWFWLEPHVLAATLEAFDQEHPVSVDQVKAENLPIFLSGVFSAIQWEVAFASPERQAEIAGREEFITALDNFYRQRTTDDNLAWPIAGVPASQHGGNDAVNSTTYEAPPYSEPEPLQATTGGGLAKRAIDAIGVNMRPIMCQVVAPTMHHRYAPTMHHLCAPTMYHLD